MTEDEAKTKWCPFARTLTTIDSRNGPIAATAINRADQGNSPCLASACMAWRTISAEREFDGVGKEVPSSAPYPNGHIRRVVIGGFCGLAGPDQ